MLDIEMRQIVNYSRTLGTGPLSIYMEDSELSKLCAVIAYDLEKLALFPRALKNNLPTQEYYSIPLDWFLEPIEVDFEKIFIKMKKEIPDFVTYFKTLAELHKRRKKFDSILASQSIPEMEQIVPRCLLEYGMRPNEVMASWLIWRKWIYDIDNRSAQETGYLFEPIIASALGGISFSSSKSPVKRTKNHKKGRQVDCIEGKNAYEFKMRVTIAASGQGRFGEELSFAEDCYNSGYKPILVVLDPTPSNRLTDLIAEYKKYGGKTFHGDEAWKFIEKKSGNVMGSFIKKYVEQPIRSIESSYKSPESIKLTHSRDRIDVKIGKNSFIIDRTNPK
jgi:hypothetical protein